MRLGYHFNQNIEWMKEIIGIEIKDMSMIAFLKVKAKQRVSSWPCKHQDTQVQIQA